MHNSKQGCVYIAPNPTWAIQHYVEHYGANRTEVIVSMADKWLKYINSDNDRAVASFKKYVKKHQGSLVRIHHDPDSKPGTVHGEHNDKKRKKKKKRW